MPEGFSTLHLEVATTPPVLHLSKRREIHRELEGELAELRARASRKSKSSKGRIVGDEKGQRWRILSQFIDI